MMRGNVKETNRLRSLRVEGDYKIFWKFQLEKQFIVHLDLINSFSKKSSLHRLS